MYYNQKGSKPMAKSKSYKCLPQQVRHEIRIPDLTKTHARLRSVEMAKTFAMNDIITGVPINKAGDFCDFSCDNGIEIIGLCLRDWKQVKRQTVECQCGSCEQIFDKAELTEGLYCPACGSVSWVVGYIDDPS